MNHRADRKGCREMVYALLFFCIALLLFILLMEEKMIYFPARHPEGFREVPPPDRLATTEEPGMEDCAFLSEDGIRLHGWLLTPPLSPTSAPSTEEMVLLWFHGNAGNLAHRYPMAEDLLRIPVRVFLVDYRGYGKSEGKPSEKGLYRDAAAAWRYLTEERRISPSRIILFGKSLGSAPAVDLAARVEPAGLIVQSGFTSAPDMARTLIPFWPSFLLRTKMNSEKKIRSVSCPKLFIHSPADEVVPYRLGKRLYEAAPEPKRFYEIPGAPHNETWLVGGEAYLDVLRDFIVRAAPPRSSS